MNKFLKYSVFFVAFAIILSSCKEDEPDVDFHIIPDAVNMIVGDIYPLTVNPAGEAYTWSSSSSAVASVSAEGVVTAAGTGTATISVSLGGKTKTVTVTVGSLTAVTGLTVEENYIKMQPNEFLRIETTLLPLNHNDKNDLTLRWETSDRSVAIVDRNGNLNSVSTGEAIISVSVEAKPETKIQIRIVVFEYLEIGNFTSLSGGAYSRSTFTFVKNGKYAIPADPTEDEEEEEKENIFFSLDFFTYDAEEDVATFIGESGVYDVYYSERYNFFWANVVAHVEPDAYWFMGPDRTMGAPVWHNDFATNSWSMDNYSRLGYVRMIDEQMVTRKVEPEEEPEEGEEVEDVFDDFYVRVYQIHMLMRYDSGGDFYILKWRNWTNPYLNIDYLTGDTEGIGRYNNSAFAMGLSEDFVEGYFRLTLTVDNDPESEQQGTTLHFERLDY